jgi:DNA polymerase-3 subunit delta'
VRANVHPDLMVIQKEEKGQMIKIDQVRAAIAMINTTPMLSFMRIIIIHDVESLNMAAANALLKTLEEPTPNTLLILISDSNLNLPLTILSRCQKIIFKKPGREETIQWLTLQSPSRDPKEYELACNLSHGAPYQALEILKNETFTLRQMLLDGLVALSQNRGDPLTLAKTCMEHDLSNLLQLLLSWLYDLLRFKLTQGVAPLKHIDYAELFGAFNITQTALLDYIDLVEERFKKIIQLQNLNRQLLLEELWIHWAHCYVSR